jgi:hypothetical protein
MADRSAARVFGSIFEVMAEDSLDALPLRIWNMSKRYDFSPCQMDCDDALIKLGLAVDRGDDGIGYR